MFAFAESAKRRFETGNLREKGYILSCLGSNLIFEDKQLRIEGENELIKLFSEVTSTVQEIHGRFEPKKHPQQRLEL